jgi:hypothetical protein
VLSPRYEAKNYEQKDYVMLHTHIYTHLCRPVCIHMLFYIYETCSVCAVYVNVLLLPTSGNEELLIHVYKHFFENSYKL